MPRRKALIIGINYFGSKHQLNGCINDAMNIRNFLIQDRGFSPAPHGRTTAVLKSLPSFFEGFFLRHRGASFHKLLQYLCSERNR